MHCQACSTTLPENAKYCPQCGKVVLQTRTDVPSEEKSETTTRDCESPPDVAPHKEFLAERRVATVMFADISGFTSFSETADPENLRDLINSCFQQLVPIILEHGGQIDKFIGDEIMALFGATQANEDDARRALTAALKMISAMSEFSRTHDMPWNLHVGINTGLVVAGMVGAESRQKFSVIGDAVNVAARLVGQAKPGEILVGEKTYQLSRNDFIFEPTPEVILKGKSEPLTLYRLKGPCRTEASARAAPAMRAPLLGRAEEVATITGLLNTLEAGNSFILLVSGEAGVGKSRLLAEIKRSSSLRWFEGKSVPMGRAISYWPFIQLLREFFGIGDTCNVLQAGELIESRMRDLFPTDHQDLAPYIAQLLSVSLPGASGGLLEKMSAENLRFLIYRAVHRLFRRIAKKSPIVLVFEDIHWADQSTLDLIEHIASVTKKSTIGLILIERSEEAANILSLKQNLHNKFKEIFREIELLPLSYDVSRRLCEVLLNVEEFELAPVVDMVIGKSEGNPFYLEEMLNALIDMKKLVFDSRSGDWKVQGDRLQIPESLSVVVLSRLDRLEDGVRDIAKYASVVGRSFLYKILLEMIKDRDALERNLAILLQIEIIREKMNKYDREYIFKHALFQKITYESILKQERKVLHKYVAEIIEMLFHDRLDEFFGLLAYHYSKAEDWKKAHEFLLKAGEKASRIGADAEALDLYHQTLTTYHKAFGEQIDHFDAAVMHRKMGEALFRKGQHHLAEEYLLKSLEFYGSKYPVGKFNIRLCIFKNIITQILNRIILLRKEINVNKNSNINIRELFYIRKSLGFIYFFTNRELYLLNSISALNESEKIEYNTEVFYYILGFGLILTVNGFFSFAEIYFGIASKIVPQLESDHGIYYHLSGYHEDCICNWVKALEYYDKAIHVYKKSGEIKLWASAACLRIELMLYTGESPDHAFEIAQELCKMGDETGDKQLLAWGLTSLGLTLLYMRKLEDSIAHIQDACLLLAAIPDYYILLCSYCHLIECRIEQGKLKTAMQLIEKSEDLIKTRGLVGPFVAMLMLKREAAYVKRFELEINRTNRSLAYDSCKKALRMAKKFRAYLPEAYLHLGRLQYLDGNKNHLRTLSKGISLAQLQGNRIALQHACWARDCGLVEHNLLFQDKGANSHEKVA